MVRRGHAAEVIAAASEEWSADLVVMASHGRGWVDRVLIGSVTEKLLNRLPTSVLVVPMTKAPARSTPAGKRPVAAVSAH
jgi:nucleotide-binding universal stress UspA family protein